MAPSNFRTYEAQSRLLAAVIASSPGLKLDFKALAKHYGSDATASGLEHRFRPIKKQVAVIRAAVSQGVDVKTIQDVVGMNEKEICKHYGESTPQGLEFQFRTIKKDAKVLKDAVDRGQNPVAALGKSAPSTPSKRKATATPRTGGSTAKRQRKKAAVSSDDDDKEVDYENLDVKTPTKPKMPSTTPTPALSAMPGMTHEDTPDEDPAHSFRDTLSMDEQADPLKEEFEPYVKLENDPLLSQGMGEDWSEGVV